MAIEEFPKRFRHPPVVTTREMYAEPEPSDTMVWAVCPYLGRKGVDADFCDRCPAWMETDYGKAKRGCRHIAEEACKMVTAAKGKG